MKTNYTPGPWAVIEEPYRIAVECKDAILSEQYLTDETRSHEEELEAAKERQTALANSRLMAASPEMAELLNRISNWLVCAPIATPEDMAQSFAPFQQEIDALLVKAGCQ